VSFFVCNNHLNELSGVIAERAGLDDAPASPEHVRSIHDDLAAHFIPSTMVVPVGVAAIIALQEARFTYLP
jgi:intracellular sulfur oxidation DsrE/DsrF family protein